MSKQIILRSDEVVCCPECDHKFPLFDGIARQTIEHYAQSFDEVLKTAESAPSEELTQEAEYRLALGFNSQIETLKEQLAERDKTLEASKARVDELMRETQIERVTLNMMGMCGELQAIAQNALPQLDDIARLPAAEGEYADARE